MKIIVAGNGNVGDTLVSQLSGEGHEVTIIDQDREVVGSRAERYDVMGVLGNCASVETLKSAGTETSDVFIATTGSDELNLLSCITAHAINPRIHTVARISNPEYYDQAFKMRELFSLSLVFSPELQAANEIEKLIRLPGFMKRDTFARGRAEIVELKVESGSSISGVALSELYSIIKCRVLVCSVVRNGNSVTPDGRFVLKEGDRLFVTAPTESLTVLLKNLGIVPHKAKKVFLVGGGTIGYHLAKSLLKSHVDVRILDKDIDVCTRLATLLPEATVINGDACDTELLEREEFSSSDAVITLTSDDELNIIVSLYASSRRIPQVITKLSRRQDNDIINSLSIGSVICPKKLSSSTVTRYVRAVGNQSGGALTVHTIGDGTTEAIEFLVDESTENLGVALKDMRLKENIRIACIIRESGTEIPNGDSCLSVGDGVIVVASGGALITQLNDIFR